MLSLPNKQIQEIKKLRYYSVTVQLKLSQRLNDLNDLNE